ncbi:NUDIX domain-containing protein [Roseovarius sp. SCSIO 43702]|uniref:NUDIX domain-containing protein n=1 Tax=Roseovarius sp. SCSIO 43702 TaxID=2823043 RepID=UPI001C73399B|nr:NUDIX domain-containing protein [Roseovarius sp. SCSIO 43702]QYX57955.1 NUDIX domain-containing protein [Roseovarius sp. SCSIO 43702]
MSDVILGGPLRDSRLRRVVLGRDVSGKRLTDPREEDLARLDHYATAAGLSFVSGERYGTDPDGGAAALDLVMAEVIMGAFGHVSAGTLAERRGMIRARAASRLAASEGVPADVRSATTADTIDVRSREVLHEGFYAMRGFDLRHPTFGGGMSDRVRREVFIATDAALVLPYDPVRDRVLLVEQFRMGPFGRGDPRPWMLEPVAGRVDPGETPEHAARREAREEANLDLRYVEPMSSHYCSPGCSTEYFHLFIGLCDLPDEAEGRGGLETEHEDIRTHVLDFEGAMRLLDTGEADNGPLILSLLWLARNRDRLRAIC